MRFVALVSRVCRLEGRRAFNARLPGCAQPLNAWTLQFWWQSRHASSERRVMGRGQKRRHPVVTFRTMTPDAILAHVDGLLDSGAVQASTLAPALNQYSKKKGNPKDPRLGRALEVKTHQMRMKAPLIFNCCPLPSHAYRS